MALQARVESASDTPATAKLICVAPNVAPADTVPRSHASVSSSPPAETIRTLSVSEPTVTFEIVSVLPGETSHAEVLLPGSNVGADAASIVPAASSDATQSAIVTNRVVVPS